MYIASVDCRNQQSRALFWSSAMLSLLAAFHFPLLIITLIENQSHTDCGHCGKQKTGAQDSLKVIKLGVLLRVDLRLMVLLRANLY